MHILIRKAKAVCRERDFDVVLSTMNECDIGEKAIQYIHYPWAKFPRPDADYRWYHFGLPLRLYRWGCAALSGYREDGIRNNVTLVNSDWTGEVFKRYYGSDTQTLYPPVPGGFPAMDFDRRENGFVCVGRISVEKELDKLITILDRVRQRGHDIRFHIIGQVDQGAYAEKLRAFAAPHAGWLSFHHDLPRDEMVSLIARQRYGIHGMVGEHFGIAPAELQRAGCITFVPDDGGPVEIVGRDERVIYHSVDDAVEKIDRVLSDNHLRETLVRDVNGRKEIFSEDRFMQEIVEAVETFRA
jgi:glycosyltransferase involved in cell wall biosynthesis